MSNIDNNTIVSNKNVEAKRKNVTGLSPEERKERIKEQKRRWFRNYRANEENRKIRNAYNAEKQKGYYAEKKLQSILTF